MSAILFDTRHRPLESISDGGPQGYSQVTEVLLKRGKTVKQFSDALTEGTEGSVLWISIPRTAFTPREIDTIVSKVSGGMGLLLTGEWGNIEGHAEVLNPLAKRFGVQFRYDRVTDPENAYTDRVSYDGMVMETKTAPQFVRIHHFSKHPITDDVGEVVYFSGCSLRAPEEIVLAWTSDRAFADLNADKQADKGERRGRFAIATAKAVDSGRVVCIGDSSVLTNRYLAKADNRRFVLRVFRWLSKEL